MSGVTDEIKSKLDIVDYIGSVVELKRAGRNFKALCPFHQERTPSFMVSPERQTWRCFGACQTGGDIISFVMKLENLTFYEALKELAQKTGTKLDNLDFEDRAWQQKQKLVNINSLAQKYYHFVLTKHKAGSAARKYLKDRGVSDKIIETFGLGFAPTAWDGLLSFLLKKGAKGPDIVDAGLAIPGRSGYYDRFRGRVIFPLTDHRGTIVGFSGRLLGEGKEAQLHQGYDGQAKYVNTPETSLYQKRTTLYGLTQGAESIRKEGRVIVVEGEFDMLSLYAAGISNTVAIKGSALTQEQLMLLKRYTQHLVLALDADFSGGESTRRAIADAETLDFKVDVVPLGTAKDPDEAIKNDELGFKKKLKKPVSIYDFVISHAIKKYGTDDAFAKKDVVTAVLPFIADITNPIIHDHFVKKLAEKLDADKESIEQSIMQFKRKVKKKSTKSFIQESTVIDRGSMLQQYILSVALQSRQPKNLILQIKEVLSSEDFATPSYQKLLSRLEKRSEREDKFDINDFARSLPTPLQDVFDELFLYDVNLLDEPVIKKDFSKSLLQLKRFSIKKLLKKQMEEPDLDEATIKELSGKLTQVEKELTIM